MTSPCVGCGLYVDGGGNLQLGTLPANWPFIGPPAAADGGQIRCDDQGTVDGADDVLWGWPRNMARSQKLVLSEWASDGFSILGAGSGVYQTQATSGILTITNPSTSLTYEYIEVYAGGTFTPDGLTEGGGWRYDGAGGYLIGPQVQRNVNGAGFTPTSPIMNSFRDYRFIPPPGIDEMSQFNVFVDRYTLGPGVSRTVQLRAQANAFHSGPFLASPTVRAAAVTMVVMGVGG